jgi:Glycosyl transferase family 11
MRLPATRRLFQLAKPDGVTIYPIERFGNQLFIYAAGLSAARGLGVPCYANRGFFGTIGPKRTYSTTYDLDQFDSGLVIPEEDRFHEPVDLGFETFPRLGHVWFNEIAPRVPGSREQVFMESGFPYDPRIEEISPGTTILGFFQSWKYFADIAQEVRDRILTGREPSDWYLAMCKQLTPGSGSIVVNMRRTDYKLGEQRAFHGLATREYYFRALDIMRRLGLDGPVYVASDSLDDAMAEMQGVENLVPIAPPPGVHPIEVLRILARCDGFIAANSTFSWWGGFLGEREDHVVVAPRPWFTATHLDTRDLLPPNWLTLERD